MLKVSVELGEMLMLVKRKRHATPRASFGSSAALVTVNN
jgi:hypothetical protein